MIYEDLRVVDLSTRLAGAYCAKLLTDLGADVVRIEPADGDPMRAARPELCAYLRTSQRSVTSDRAAELTSAADVVVGGLDVPRGAPVSVAISSFGSGGPDSGLELPEPVLQARSGALSGHGHMDCPPLTIGGELGEHVTGVFAALGATTAWRRAKHSGEPEHVDVSMLEAMQLTMLTVPTLMARFPGGYLGTFRFVMIPGNEPCRDGEFVGITTVTAQQWRALLDTMGRADLADDDELTTMIGRFKRAREVNELLHAWTMQHTADEIVEKCAAARVPAAVVGNGELLPGFDQLAARDVFVRQPGETWIRPRAPFRFGGVPDRELAPAPKPGEHDSAAVVRTWGGTPGRGRAARPTLGGERRPADDSVRPPLEGIRVLDFTAFWSGPFATAWFVAMGAEVIKVESVQRPDGIRFSAAVRPKDDPRYYEKSALFHAANLGKKGITLDLGHPDGLALAKRLVARVDVVAENFTPRVMEGFGLGYEQVARLEPSVIMLRLPAFGLTGPWRDRPGFAQTMEQLTGMAWVTGYEGGPPIIPGGMVDPLVGAHAALALVAALEHRDRTGEGQLVEMPMIEVAAAVTAEQVIEFSARGRLMGRRGAHGVFRCAGRDAWVAAATEDDVADSCASRAPEEAEAELRARGIPAAAMVPGFATLDDPQLRARRFFEPIEHADVGAQVYPGFPVHISGGPDRWWPGPAPTLGQHTEEVLRAELGLDADELARLRAEHVIGEVPVS